MKKPTILIVDDVADNLNIVSIMLREQGFTVRTANGGRAALHSIAEVIPDLVLLDINMPNIDGYAVNRRLKDDPATVEVPVIFVSAQDRVEEKVKAFTEGGVDYITKPYRMEELLARVERQLLLDHQRREIEELSAQKDQLIRTVSHDLKNPLGNVLGYAALLLDPNYPPTADEVQDLVGGINRSAQHMYNLVTALLDLEHIRDGLVIHKSEIEVCPFLEDMHREQMRAANDKNLRLLLELPDEDTIIYADRVRLGQVVSNLVSNAIKYTPNGGSVELASSSDDVSLTIRIADTGLGIPADDLPHLFDRFYRVNTERHLSEEGNGLGLSIVKAVVDQHGGTISVDSVEGEGTTFEVVLPLDGGDGV